MKVVITGVSGRMGRMLIGTIDAAEGGIEVAGATEREGHPWIGRDLGEAMGGTARNVIVTDDLSAALEGADAVIDFTMPAATVEHARIVADLERAIVIGTTGFSDDEIAQLDESARRAVIVRAGNMSLGVNLLTRIVSQVAAALDEAFDIEVVEAHHRHKIDAPSGTALMLGQAAAEGRGVDLAEVSDRGRDGITGARRVGDIGFSAIRGGSIIGDHEVIFAGDGETIRLSHQASDRGLFARGAVKAALWTEGRAPGSYDMLSVLGLG
ncbi:4-hydroxy-tetrahydrodipicolinate reductase [Palleronia sp. LCG004]|uniref:4-hydroxy-tetrahydrodipicolinate reductase n=1 Tax=Palleronia sp. LCG004 TaxID=3079304 RepID=UPI0029430E16|nr:4-hydroxy-tetrahydrodipicolinate reductase [Palleronia sp. LCG004]WOI55444.1 4-hydroxy-tetrahydrodipicolinate reductase [Palleronia sp. LCG004]